MEFLIGTRVRITDPAICERFCVSPRCVGKITRRYFERVTVEFIQDDLKTTLNLFTHQIEAVK